MATTQRISLEEKFSLIDKYWAPQIIGDLNGQFVKLVKLKGEFTWHQHDDEDELFLVVRGKLTIKLEGHELTLSEGELAIIPRGVRHLPSAEDDVYVLLFEPKSTVNTGEVRNERTIDCGHI